MTKDIELDIECTCGACPTQYEGTVTIDGETHDLDFRYRYGHWRVVIGPCSSYGLQGFTVQGDVGDALGGVMDYDEVLGFIEDVVRAFQRDKARKILEEDE